ncbi:MAG TPA: LLM class flavin-dependent oxidoreductase [Gammaproteobacteria bacterium]|nr:LLM class flavin-dependent oxidoreductase [Gammaproteobacteria bacterium]HIN59627.1 LLM class flavin-dependent oxidoreductase [Gammaproteobacteria bacterium]
MSAVPKMALRLSSAMSATACVRLAVVAEESGFSTLWFAENPYQRGVLPAVVACAGVTNRIHLGIGVFNPYNRHPTLMAMEIGALDELSRGRAILGIGSGVPAWVERITPYRRPLQAVRDAVSIVRGLLSGEEVNYRGKMYSASGVRLEYELVRSHVPVHVAAMGDRMLLLCGELADGLLIGNMCPPAFTVRASHSLREGAKRAAREPPAEVTKYLPCVVDQDGNAARKMARNAIGKTLSVFWQAYQSAPAALVAIREGNEIEADRFEQALLRLANGEPGENVLDDAFVEAYGVAGTTDECIEQIQSLGSSGVTQLTVTMLGDTPEWGIRQLGTALSGI